MKRLFFIIFLPVIAVGAMKALDKRKTSMPVIGFNNSILAECATPALTSVDNRLSELCTTAADMLPDILSGKEVSQKVTFPAGLVERDTFSVSQNG